MPALSKEEALRRLFAKQEAYAETIREIYAEAETNMLGKVARRLERGIEQPGWAEHKLAEITALNKEIGVEVADLRKQSPEILAAIEAAYADGAAVGAATLIAANLTDLTADIRYAGGMASRTLAAATVDALESTHFRVLRTAQDVYRNTISEAVGQVVTGPDTIRQAVQSALNRFADSGVTGFVDTAGRNWDLTSYTEMAVRTATSNAADQGHLDKLQANGQDLVIVTAHGGCCPLCGPWENRVLSISGQSADYPSVFNAKAAGLKHPNCRHHLDLYIEGVTTPSEVTYDPAGYKAEQKQRYNERAIRRWKRREVAAITPEEQLKASTKRKQWQAAQRAHIKDANAAAVERHGEGWLALRRDYWRERV